MVSHPWYVLHIPGTNAYMPIWVVAGLLLVLVTVIVVPAAMFLAMSSKRHDENP
jgi:hypothetical protein